MLVLSPNQPSAIDWTKKKITQTGIFSDIAENTNELITILAIASAHIDNNLADFEQLEGH